jgi:hypothetical protein
VTLQPGDILYLPRGMVHSTIAIAYADPSSADHSIHYTVGVETETLALTIDNLLNCAAGLTKDYGLLSAIRTHVQSSAEDEKVSEGKESLGVALRRSLDVGFLGLKYVSADEVVGVDAFEIHLLKKVSWMRMILCFFLFFFLFFLFSFFFFFSLSFSFFFFCLFVLFGFFVCFSFSFSFLFLQFFHCSFFLLVSSSFFFSCFFSSSPSSYFNCILYL